VGPEYLALAVTAIASAVSGGTWVANKILNRQNQDIQQAFNYTNAQKRRIDILEDQINRMPLDYVLKVDFLREIKEMHDNFREINNKLDKLMEKLLAK
jgi:microcompartment protein CcmL/EutN